MLAALTTHDSPRPLRYRRHAHSHERAGERAFARVFANFFGVSDGTEKLKFAGRTDVAILREFFVHNAIEPSAENLEQFFEAYVFMLDHMLQSLPGGAHPGV